MKMRFYHWLGISLALHTAAILPIAISAFPRLERTSSNKLAVELFGMVSNRQMEEKKKVGDPLAPKDIDRPTLSTPVPTRKVEAKRPEAIHTPIAGEEPPEFASLPLAESTVPELPAFVGSTMEDHGITGNTGTVFVPLAGADVSSRGSGGKHDEDQPATRVGDRLPVDRIRVYTAMVARRLQENLIYPSEMRRKGIEGVAIIVFTIMESGRIKRDSLKVRESSGCVPLDKSAMKSAQASEPFAKPPKELTLAIEVSFEIESKKGG